MSKAPFLAGVAWLSVAAGSFTSAHHSLAQFDGTRIVRIEGKVTDFRWVNPHASVVLFGSVEGNGPDGLWTVEMNAPNVLMGEGWERSSVAAGDQVILYARPPRSGVTSAGGRALYVGAVLARGRTLGSVRGSDRGH